MTDAPISTDLLFRNDAGTPLGRITLAGYIAGSAGVRTPRRLGHYAIVFLLEGHGHYQDERGVERDVSTGDMLILFPDIMHTYGPQPGGPWSELYVVFDGPAFDAWRQIGVLNPAQPVRRLQPRDSRVRQLDAILRAPARTPHEQALVLSRFLAVLTDMLTGSPGYESANVPDWLDKACLLLERNLDQPLDVAQVAAEVGIGYEAFRKLFRRQLGVSPARYRAIRRIDAACVLLQREGCTSASVAAALGFSDEYHFSRRFKQVTGLSPRAFRQRLPHTSAPEQRRQDRDLPV